MTSAIFWSALEFTLRWEGGLGDDPSDPGGLTNFGISKRAHPEVDVSNLTRDDAAAIYKLDYWDRLQCDSVPTALSIALFDFGVNAGHRRAARNLQAIVGVERDGRVGPNTIDAVWGGSASRLLLDSDLATDLTTRRAKHLVRLALQRPPMRKFLQGWMARCIAVAVYAEEIASE